MPDADSTVNLQVSTAYDGSGATAAQQGLGTIAAAGKSAAADLAPLANAPVKLTGAEQAEAQLQRLSGDADRFIDSLRQGVGIDIGGRIVSAVAALPAAFQAAIDRGVAFNATVESATLGVAAILRQFQPEQFGSVNAALGKSGEVIEQLKGKATETTASFQDLVQAFSANAGAATAAGVPISKQADLLVTLSNAVSGLGISTQQLTQETRALLTGEIDQNAQVARTLGITREQIEQAKAQGQVYEFLTGKLKAFGEAGALAGQTYAGAWSNLGDTIDQVLGSATEPVFEELRRDYLALAEELKKPEVVTALREIGFEVAAVVRTGAGLLNFAVQNAGALSTLAQGTVAFGVAVSAVRLKDLVLGLGAKVLGLRASTAATAAETAAVVADTEATVANTAAKRANAAASGAQASGAGSAGGTGAGAVSNIAGALNVGILAGGALAAVIEMLTARIEAATAHASDLGKAFDSARGNAAQIVRDASTYASAQERTKKLQADIAALTREVAQETVTIGDETGTVTTYLTQQGETAANFLLQKQNELKLIAGIRSGNIDVSNTLKDQTAELQRQAPLQGEALKKANDLAAALNDRRLASQSLARQEDAIRDTLTEQLNTARDRLGKLGVDPASLRSISDANGLFDLSGRLQGNLRAKTLEEATALGELEDRLKGIKDKRQETATKAAESLAKEKTELGEINAKIAATNTSEQKGREEVNKLLERKQELVTSIAAKEKAAAAQLNADNPGIKKLLDDLTARRDNIPLTGLEGDANTNARGELNRQIDQVKKTGGLVPSAPATGSGAYNPQAEGDTLPNDPGLGRQLGGRFGLNVPGVDQGAVADFGKAAADFGKATSAINEGGGKIESAAGQMNTAAGSLQTSSNTAATALQTAANTIAGAVTTAVAGLPAAVAPIGTAIDGFTTAQLKANADLVTAINKRLVPFERELARINLRLDASFD